ncbi:MAG: C10 family peptidase [Bacteroidales bacterium]|nr:C10 family peptidase [Bacteroidales bacterium]
MKNLITLIAFLLISIFAFADFVPKNIAEKAALNYIKAYYHHIEKDGSKILISNTIEKSYNNTIVYYTVVFNNDNFVHIAADDASYPILGFSIDGKINKELNAENYDSWMLQYAEAVFEIKEKNLVATLDIEDKWSSITKTDKGIFLDSKSISPLLLSKWNQDSPYNSECPIDAAGPGGRVYAGCVAVAMAQILYYYRYPEYGTGSHSYNHSVYGNQTANFGSTNYKWNEMQNQMGYGGNFEIAQLLQHLGISVDMGYSAAGSGAYSFTVPSALTNYFGYQTGAVLKHRNDYSQTQWNSLITTSLDNKIPLYYHGRDSQGNAGHAFNLDGYQGSDFFHFNWGWGGSYDGFYYLSQLNPGGSDFSSGQGAVFNIYPANNYPEYCNTTTQTITAKKGTITDQSGPSDYLPNSDCQWLIQPNGNIEKIKFDFNKFELASDDTLYFYDGASTSSPLLAKYSGNTIPSSLTSTVNSVLIKLSSTSSNEGDGFFISYSSIYYTYCNGTMIITDSIASISDGSGSSPYNNNSLCKWYIKPTNGLPIKLSFDSFDTEAGVDFVKIYNPEPTPSELLAIYSGNNIPQSVISPSGKMLITFITNPNNTNQGWSASYITADDVSIEKINKIDPYIIYPNPTKDYIHISNNGINPIEDISIFSINGKLIIRSPQNDLNRTNIEIDLQGLSEGIYFIHIKDKETVFVKKLIIL